MAMKRCPYSAPKNRGAHELCIILPSETAEQIVLMVCGRCGDSVRHAMTLPTPIDDLSAADIEQLVKRPTR